MKRIWSLIKMNFKTLFNLYPWPNSPSYLPCLFCYFRANWSVHRQISCNAQGLSNNNYWEECIYPCLLRVKNQGFDWLKHPWSFDILYDSKFALFWPRVFKRYHWTCWTCKSVIREYFHFSFWLSIAHGLWMFNVTWNISEYST